MSHTPQCQASRMGRWSSRSARSASWFLAGILASAPLSCNGASKLRNPPDTVAHADAVGDPALTGTGALPAFGSLAAVAQKVTPSVVSVFSERKQPAKAGPELSPFFSDPFFEFFFGTPRPGPQRRPPRVERSLGSGVIVSSDGVILTNHHVIENADEVRVALSDGRELKAELVGTDAKSDLAVLRVKEKQLPALEFADSSKLRTGDLVLAVGNPFGLGQTVTMGIISAVGRANMGITDYEDFIQTDAAINPGNSGGALVTLDGRLAGINTAIVSRSGGYQGIGFAIPSRMAIQIKEAILREGRVVRGFLGVTIQDLSPELASALGVEPKSGVLVSDVAEDSPAAKAGIQRGDIIRSFDGKRPTDSTQLRLMVAEAGRGKKVNVEVLRDGKPRTFVVELSSQPDEAGAEPARGGTGAERGDLEGVTLQELDPEARRALDLSANLRGVLVRSVDPGSRAASAGLRQGDVILEVNRKPTPNVQALRQALKQKQGPTLLLVYRQGSTFYMTIAE